MDHHKQDALTPVACHVGALAPSRRRVPSGMTLLEVSISTAMVGVIVLVTFSTLSREGKMATEQMVEIKLQSDLRRCTDALVDELTDVHLIALSAEARWVDYNKPLLNRAGAPVIVDGKQVYGAYDVDGTFHENWFYHLEAVDEISDGVYISERDLNQNVDGDVNNWNTSLLYFRPVRFDLATYRRDKGDLTKFNTGDAVKEAARLAAGNARLQCSAILDTWDASYRRCARTLAVRCFRDSTARAAAPWDKGEGIFYQRAVGRRTDASPMLKANTFTDSNSNGYLETAEFPTVDYSVYPDVTNAPLVYSRRYFEADIAPTYGTADASDNTQVNNVVDTATEMTYKGQSAGQFWQRLRLVIFVVSGGEQDVNADGINDNTRIALGLGSGGRVAGVTRVICAQTIVHLTVCDR